MSQIEMFHAAKQIELTEAEYLKLKNQLFSLRRRYIKKIWGSDAQNDRDLHALEQKIHQLEEKLAHALVTE
jgi:hypothetical protein